VKINDFFPEDEIEEWRKIVYEFQDKLLMDNNLTDLNAVLTCIYMCCNKNKKAEVDYSEVKDLFLGFGRKFNNFKVNLHNAKKKDFVCERIDAKAKMLSLTMKGLKSVKELIGDTIGTKTLLIEAGKVYSGKKLFQEILRPSIGSSLKICDPYVGARTLDIVSIIDHKCKVMLLTQSVDKKSVFQRELKDFQKEYTDISIEVRLFSKSTLHDRYMISDGAAWSIGSSLKDLGNKDTIVTRLGDEIRYALEEMFEERWQESAPLTDV
jgi:hypothetical protein